MSQRMRFGDPPGETVRSAEGGDGGNKAMKGALILLALWALAVGCGEHKGPALAPWDYRVGKTGYAEDGSAWRLIRPSALLRTPPLAYRWDTEADTAVGRGQRFLCGTMKFSGEFQGEIADCRRILVISDSIKVSFIEEDRSTTAP